MKPIIQSRATKLLIVLIIAIIGALGAATYSAQAQTLPLVTNICPEYQRIVAYKFVKIYVNEIEDNDINTALKEGWLPYFGAVGLESRYTALQPMIKCSP